MSNLTLETGRRPMGRRSSFWHRDGTAFYGFIGLWLLGFVVLQLFPMLFALYISLTNYDGMDLGQVSFVGLSNFKQAFQDSNVYYTLGRSFIYWILSLPIGGAVALGLAVLLNRSMRGRGFFRTMFYLPTMVPVAATSLLFANLFIKDFGLINMLLGLIRPGTNIDFVHDYGMICLVALSVWGMGATMVLFLAGLQGIPEELKEAAEIDGANKRQVFQHVTWPLLSPVTYFIILTGTVGAFQMYVPAILLNSFQGGWVGASTVPPDSIYVNLAYIFNNMLQMNQFGYGAALTWILFLIIMALTLIIRAFSKRLVYYEVDSQGGGKK